MPQISTTIALSPAQLSMFEDELRGALHVHLSRVEEATELDDISVAVRRKSEEALAEIAAALTRIRDGSFGLCSYCATPIELVRLEAVPHTRYCTTCAGRAGSVGGRRRGH